MTSERKKKKRFEDRKSHGGEERNLKMLIFIHKWCQNLTQLAAAVGKEGIAFNQCYGSNL